VGAIFLKTAIHSYHLLGYIVAEIATHLQGETGTILTFQASYSHAFTDITDEWVESLSFTIWSGSSKDQKREWAIVEIELIDLGEVLFHADC